MGLRPFKRPLAYALVFCCTACLELCSSIRSICLQPFFALICQELCPTVPTIPASLRQALLDSGYATLGALAFAVPASPANAQETFIMNVLGLDAADPAALMLPEAACGCLWRLLCNCRAWPLHPQAQCRRLPPLPQS